VAQAVDRNLYFNNNTGEYEEGYRDPVTHVIHFGSGEPPQATEAAIRKAQELSVSIGQVEGTGQEGRVTAPDVESHYKAAQEATAEPEPPTPPLGGEEPQDGSQQPQDGSQPNVNAPQAPEGSQPPPTGEPRP
jgi:pyruvate/2-oxoglutarate dehydrogenase complex dihydrolipoamide acyltransferase (E2) component